MQREKFRFGRDTLAGFRGGILAAPSPQWNRSMNLNQQNKMRVWEFWQALDFADQAQTTSVAHQYMSGDVQWHG